MTIEHVNHQLKVFRILQERYRNRKDSFNQRALFYAHYLVVHMDTFGRISDENSLFFDALNLEVTSR